MNEQVIGSITQLSDEDMTPYTLATALLKDWKQRAELAEKLLSKIHADISVGSLYVAGEELPRDKRLRYSLGKLRLEEIETLIPSLKGVAP